MEKSSIHYFTTQIALRPESKVGSQESPWGLPISAEAEGSKPSSTALLGHKQGTRLELQQPGHMGYPHHRVEDQPAPVYHLSKGRFWRVERKCLVHFQRDSPFSSRHGPKSCYPSPHLTPYSSVVFPLLNVKIHVSRPRRIKFETGSQENQNQKERNYMMAPSPKVPQGCCCRAQG